MGKRMIEAVFVGLIVAILSPFVANVFVPNVWPAIQRGLFELDRQQWWAFPDDDLFPWLMLWVACPAILGATFGYEVWTYQKKAGHSTTKALFAAAFGTLAVTVVGLLLLALILGWTP